MNQDRALNDVKDAIDKIRTELPRNIDEPIVAHRGRGPVDPHLRRLRARHGRWRALLVRRRRGDAGAAWGEGRRPIERYGGVDREIRVALDPDRLLASASPRRDVNHRCARPTSISAAAAARSAARSRRSARSRAPAGGGSPRDRDRASGWSQDAARRARHRRRRRQRAALACASRRPAGRRLRLFAPRARATLSVAESSRRSAASCAVALSRCPADEGSTRWSLYPGNYTSAIETLIEGAVLAVLVVFLFLRDWRATVISAVALPLSVIPTFWAMTRSASRSTS